MWIFEGYFSYTLISGGGSTWTSLMTLFVTSPAQNQTSSEMKLCNDSENTTKGRLEAENSRYSKHIRSSWCPSSVE